MDITLHNLTSLALRLSDFVQYGRVTTLTLTKTFGLGWMLGVFSNHLSQRTLSCSVFQVQAFYLLRWGRHLSTCTSFGFQG